MTELFNVVFAGEISGKADPAVVRANLAKLFNANDAVLDRLFSGQPVAIKKMVNRETAMLLRARMKQAGANTRMVQVDEQGRPVASAPVAEAPPVGSMADRVVRLAAEQAKTEAAKPKADAPPAPADVKNVKTWALYPTGWLLGAPLPKPAPLMPVISGISLAQIGADLLAESERAKVAPVLVDISGLSLAAAGSDVLKDGERRQVQAVSVDISGLSMAAAGTELEELREEKVLLKPDISHIRLVGE